ncbi:MAG: right-handed parallel beta-helix repeat-containing protein [Cryobacterium sp.]|nr:right-handed parallel beta-helix repeat-containing protein [Cryobacterium sp.]
MSTVEELRAAVAAGGVHTLSAASFLLDEPLIASRDLTLVGSGTTVTTGRGAGAPASVLRVRWATAGLIVVEGASVRIEGVHLDGVVSGTFSSDGTRDHGDGLDLIRVLHGRLEVVGSHLTRARLGPPDSEKVYGRGSAIYVAGASTARVVDSVFSDNQLAALEAICSASLEVTDSRLAGNLNGVFAEGTVQLALHGNAFQDHTGSALILRGATVATISGNTLSGNGSSPDTGRPGADGVRIGDRAVVELSDNRFDGSPRYAVSIYGSARVTSVDNLFANSGGYIETDGFERSALLVEDDAVMFSSGDAFVENPGGGIEVFGNAHLELTNAEIRRNGSFASMYLGDAATALLIEVVVTDNDGSVTVVDSAHLTVRGGSYATSNTDAIYVAGFASLTLSGAELRNNRGFGVSVSDSASAEVDQAVVAGNRGGITFLDGAQGSVTNSRFMGNTAGRALVYRLDADVTVEGNVVE